LSTTLEEFSVATDAVKPMDQLMDDPLYKAVAAYGESIQTLYEAFGAAVVKTYGPFLDAFSTPAMMAEIDRVMREMERIERRRTGAAWARRPEPRRMTRFTK
jgi:hypothetical protein